MYNDFLCSNLRTRLSKQSYEFLKKQRISCLLEGAWFPCPLSNQRMSVIPSSSSINGTLANPSTVTNNSSSLGMSNTTMSNNTNTGKRWRYYKLSRSKRSIMYGDFSEKIAPVLKSYEKLPNRIDLSSVNEIRSIRKASIASLANNSSQIFNNNSSVLSSSLTAGAGTIDGNVLNNSNLLSAGQQQNNGNLAFALYSDKYTPIAEFYCATATQAAEWKDGFSMILDKRFTSKETAELFHTLTEVGVKVKLLQIAGDRVEIPHGVVEIPPVPPGLGTGFFYDTIES